MAANYDASEFIDGDFQRQQVAAGGSSGALASQNKAPTREEVDTKVVEAQKKLAELKRAQEELERERAMLEETRRRQAEFQTGREEMIRNLTRGVGLLEESGFAARRDAESMSRSADELKESLAKIQMIREESWTKEGFSVQLTQALTTLENARMEWNSARLKFPVLSETAQSQRELNSGAPQGLAKFADMPFRDLCRLGLALTWPVAAAVFLLGFGVLVLLLRK